MSHVYLFYVDLVFFITLGVIICYALINLTYKKYVFGCGTRFIQNICLRFVFY